MQLPECVAQVAEMLCVDPWRELLPSDSRQKENARVRATPVLCCPK